MRQILQSGRTGKLELVEVPAPSPGPGQVLVRTRYSVMSPGTDKLVMDFARKSLVAKARSRPDLVKQVVRKLQQEGPLPTYRTVTTRLDAPQPMGYSVAGEVVEVGEGVAGFAPGDRVACAGAGYANHAELCVVPENLVAAVPEGVALEHAAFSTLGAIALQGVRVADPTLGEVGAVVGLGLIGQITVQLLRANGCRVLGIDLDPARNEEAKAQGADWVATPSEVADGFSSAETEGDGVDFVIVTAGSDSSAPVAMAANLCRQRGRVVCVGATGMDLDRRSFYDKELELRMSMSYGPGRYDRRYEEQGLDYPRSYVRWTENRNLQAFLGLLATGRMDFSAVQSETLPFDEIVGAYDALARGERPSLAVVFEYPASSDASRTLRLEPGTPARAGKSEPGIAFLGAGNYAKAVLLPALGSVSGLRKVSLVTQTGPSARRSAERFGFASCGTDPAAVMDDPDVDLVFVTTRHDAHAPLATAALAAGKSVWLEKPIGLGREEVLGVANAARESGALLAVGYNRRFSPHARAIREAFQRRRGALAVRYTVAAGPPPRGTWITDLREGGGRVIGEACHFVDLCSYLVGQPATAVYARNLDRDPDRDDSMVAILDYPDGSTAVIEYLANASSELPKERFEASADGHTATCDNYRTTTFAGTAAKNVKTLNQDKGQSTAVSEVVEAVRRGAPSPFDLDDLVRTSLTTFAMLESAETGRRVPIEA
ncbi:MAG: Gfo/Idh/MocA family oxidoreductase [Myxococcota bacterium]|nr:Gfo/Idh/MocA family oxidoreductase [Myxococcota bacterium]